MPITICGCIHPQVCPQCIHRYGYCRAAWELSLGTVCVEHGSTLTVCCHECRQALRWNRPSIDVGHCGHFIKSASSQKTVSDDLLRWQKLVNEKFSSVGPTVDGAAPGWQRILQPMTLGGMFMVVTAFGCVEKSLAPIRTGLTVKNLNPTEWQAITRRAIQRLNVLDSGCDCEELSALVAQPFLLRLLHAQADTTDQP